MEHAEFVNRYTPGESDARHWGEWVVLDTGPGWAVKRLRVRPGGRLSLQRHQHRGEHWTVVAGRARVTLGTDVSELAPGESARIGVGEVHRVENPGPDDLVFIEVQHGRLLSEDDIERLDAP